MPPAKRPAPPITGNSRAKKTKPDTAPATTDSFTTKKTKVKPETAASTRSRRGSGADTVELSGFSKSKILSGAVKVTKSSETATEEKRGRGRPPVNPTNPKIKTVAPPANEAKKRGRPSRSEKEAALKLAQADLQTIRLQKPKDEAEDEVAYDSESDHTEDGHSYWLMKAEPESRIENGVDVKFSISDLEAKDEPEPWDGVRNYVARNNMRAMMKGDLAFFYHSNCKIPGIVGVMEIVKEHEPDKSALDPSHPYYDPKEKKDAPKWCVVHVKHRLTFDESVRLKDLQGYAKQGGALANMQLLRQLRLSVSKVTKKEWEFILDEAGLDPQSLLPGGDEA